MKNAVIAGVFLLVPALFVGQHTAAQSKKGQNAPAPKAPFTDYRYEMPGTTRKITVADLPAPFATKSATNGPSLVDRPANTIPIAPSGFKVELFATGLDEPRRMITAPNGDIFVAESHGRD